MPTSLRRLDAFCSKIRRTYASAAISRRLIIETLRKRWGCVMDGCEWIDNGGSVGCESPEVRCNEEMADLQQDGVIGVGGIVTYRPNGDGTYLCSCGRHFVNFAKFTEHATKVGGSHHRHSRLENAGEPWPGQPSTFGSQPDTLPEMPPVASGFFAIPAVEMYHPSRIPMPDPINHPPHYTFGKIEVINVIEDWGLSFHLAQVVKYVARSKHKGNELEDLKKAQFYLNRLITSLEK